MEQPKRRGRNPARRIQKAVAEAGRATKRLNAGLSHAQDAIRRYVDKTPGHDMRLFRAELDEIGQQLADIDTRVREFRTLAGLDRDGPGGPWRGMTIDATATVVREE